MDRRRRIQRQRNCGWCVSRELDWARIGRRMACREMAGSAEMSPEDRLRRFGSGRCAGWSRGGSPAVDALRPCRDRDGAGRAVGLSRDVCVRWRAVGGGSWLGCCCFGALFVMGRLCFRGLCGWVFLMQRHVLWHLVVIVLGIGRLLGELALHAWEFWEEGGLRVPMMVCRADTT